MKEGQTRSPIEFLAKVWKEKPSGQARGGEITKKQWVGLVALAWGENRDTDGQQASYPEAKLKKMDKAAGIGSSILLGEWQPISSLPESADEALGEFSLIYSLVSQDW